jgi:hypothetical protein
MATMAAKGDRGDAYDMVRSSQAWKDSTPRLKNF